MADLTATKPYYETLVLDEDPNLPTRVAFVCSTCERSVDDGPCPEHAPLSVPGLRLLHCEATPRHYTWELDGDQYPGPCGWCAEIRRTEEWEAERLARRKEYHGWRITRVTVRWLRWLGIVSGYGMEWGDGRRWYINHVSFRGRRSLVFGARRRVL